MFRILCDEVDQVQLDRAKQSTKSAILMNLESRVCRKFPICSAVDFPVMDVKDYMMSLEY